MLSKHSNSPRLPMSATSPLEIQAETARLEALERFCIMDTPPEPAFDRVTRLVCAIFRTPMANITLIDAHRQWFKSRIGMDDSETDRQRVGRISESVIRRAKSVGAIRFAIAPYSLSDRRNASASALSPFPRTRSPRRRSGCASPRRPHRAHDAPAHRSDRSPARS